MARFASSVQTEAIYDLFIDGANYTYDEERFMFNQFMDGSELVNIDSEGTYATWLIVPSVTGGVAPVGDGGALPRGTKSAADRAHEPIYSIYSGMSLTRQEMLASRSNRASFVSAVELQVKGATDVLTRTLNWASFATKPGGICQLSADKTISGTATATGVDNQATKLVPYMRSMTGKQFKIVDDPAASSPTVRGTVTLASNPTSETSLSFTRVGGSNITAKNNDWLVFDTFTSEGAPAASNQYGNSSQIFNGLGSLIDSAGSAHGITATAEPTWVSSEVNVGTLTEQVFNDPVLNIRAAHGTPMRLVAVAHPKDLAKYSNLFLERKRFETSNVEGGTNKPGVWVNGDTFVEFFTDNDCPEGTVFLLDFAYMACFKIGGIEWLTEPDTSQRWLRRVDGNGMQQDRYDASLVCDMSIGVWHRNAHAKLTSW